MREIHDINQYTKRTGKEASITACEKPGHNKLFVANSAKGTTEGVDAVECNTQYGKSQRIADVHSHPTNKDTIGITPSQDDWYSTLVDSKAYKKPQISCVTSPETPLTECYMPKEIPSEKKLKNYENALDDARNGNPGYYIDNVPRDFDIQFYDKKGNYVKKPNPDTIVEAAFGESRDDLRKKVEDLDRAGFCVYVSSQVSPNGYQDRVQESCKAELRRRSLFGVIEY